MSRRRRRYVEWQGAAVAPPVFLPEALNLFDRMDDTPTMERMVLINTLISKWIASGFWDKNDILYVTSAHAFQAACLNWKGDDAFNLVPVGSTTFTVDRDIKGNGSNSYFNTGYNPVSHGVMYQQDSANIGVYIRDDINAATYGDIGVRSGTNTAQAVLFARLTSGLFSPRVNVGGAGSTGISVANSLGHFVASRGDASIIMPYKDGGNIGNIALVSDAPSSNGSMLLGAIRSNGSPNSHSPRGYGCAHAGGNLTSSQVADAYAALQEYMTAIGANV